MFKWDILLMLINDGKIEPLKKSKEFDFIPGYFEFKIHEKIISKIEKITLNFDGSFDVTIEHEFNSLIYDKLKEKLEKDGKEMEEITEQLYMFSFEGLIEELEKDGWKKIK